VLALKGYMRVLYIRATVTLIVGAAIILQVVALAATLVAVVLPLEDSP